MRGYWLPATGRLRWRSPTMRAGCSPAVRSPLPPWAHEIGITSFLISGTCGQRIGHRYVEDSGATYRRGRYDHESQSTVADSSSGRVHRGRRRHRHRDRGHERHAARDRAGVPYLHRGIQQRLDCRRRTERRRIADLAESPVGASVTCGRRDTRSS